MAQRWGPLPPLDPQARGASLKPPPPVPFTLTQNRQIQTVNESYACSGDSGDKPKQGDVVLEVDGIYTDSGANCARALVQAAVVSAYQLAQAELAARSTSPATTDGASNSGNSGSIRVKLWTPPSTWSPPTSAAMVTPPPTADAALDVDVQC